MSRPLTEADRKQRERLEEWARVGLALHIAAKATITLLYPPTLDQSDAATD